MSKPTPQNYSVEAEQAIIACLLNAPKTLKRLDLVQSDFYFPNHQVIYQTICRMAEDGIEADIPTLSATLRRDNQLAEAGGPVYLAELSECGFVVINWKQYADIIRQFSLKRQLVKLAEQMHRYANNGTPDLGDEIDAFHHQIVKISNRATGKIRSMADKVKEWVLTTDGNFLTTDVYKDLSLTTRDHKKAVVMALLRMEEEGLIVKCGERRGCYRPIQAEAPEIDFYNADTSTTFPLTWPYPFDLHHLVTIYPKNIIVVAGAANAGKTAMLLNLVRLNLWHDDCIIKEGKEEDKSLVSFSLKALKTSDIDSNNELDGPRKNILKKNEKDGSPHPKPKKGMRIRYMSSEMGPEELQLRLSKFEDTPLEWWQDKRLKFLERSQNFSDLIDPDGLNLIDYLEITTDFYRIHEDIRKIFDRLRHGVAVIALQKKRGQDVGRGGELTLEKPRLYLAMDPGKLTIVKAKNWADYRHNPNGKVFQFKLIAGCRFLDGGKRA